MKLNLLKKRSILFFLKWPKYASKTTFNKTFNKKKLEELRNQKNDAFIYFYIYFFFLVE